MMKISVIIPVFNEEKYINSCLKSLYLQDQKANEIIIIDNNCTDRTINIAKKFKNIKIIKETTQGMTPARNKGFNQAKGDIFIKCDADTEFPNNFISEIKKAFSISKTSVGLTTPVYFGDLIGARKMPWLFFLYLYIPKLIIGDYPLNGPGYAITKKVWKKVKNKICLDDSRVHEDIDLSFHIKKYGRIYFLKHVFIKSSGRRIINNPSSFFGEYLSRFIKMLPSHWLSNIF